MSSELNLRFPDEAHVEVTFDGVDSGLLPFASPLKNRDRRDLAWYLEVYGAHSLGDPDDSEAARIAVRLPELGEALFEAVFNGPALRLFQRFQDQEDGPRLLTVSAEHPDILSLPWKLLRDPARGGTYLFQENPRISIRRRLAGATGGRRPFRVEPRERLHLLFVVNRPEGAGFLDPRADPRAVGIPETEWIGLRRQLEAAALVEAEDLPGVKVPFLRFHPTLASILWAQLSLEEQARLGRAHRQGYYRLASDFYHQDADRGGSRELSWRCPDLESVGERQSIDRKFCRCGDLVPESN